MNDTNLTYHLPLLFDELVNISFYTQYCKKKFINSDVAYSS